MSLEPALDAADHGDCAQLTQLNLPDVAITEAVAVPAGTGAIKVAHCRVAGVIGNEIKFSLLLPDDWNRKFLMGGGGGFVGRIDNQAQFVVNAGYATVGTDTGHSGGVTDASWALNNEERRINFGYLAVHRTAETSKAIIRSYYGAPQTRAYFSGCSNGGRQGLMEAQRYPDDFDGIVAGAPAADFTGIGAQFIKDVRAQFPDPKNLTPLLSPETMQAVAAQVLNTCDALDGVKDGVMEDPRQCKVDVSTLTGLSAAQMTALKAIYAPTRAGGETVFPAQPFGGEGEAGRMAGMDHGHAAAGSAAVAEPALWLQHQSVQVHRLQRSRMGLSHLRPVDVEEGHREDRVVAERDEPEPRRVQGQGAQAAVVARMVRRRAVAARDDQVLRERDGARQEGRRLRGDVPVARRAALCRRAGTRQRRLGRCDRRLGRERQGAGADHRAEGDRRQRREDATALRVSAARGVRRHGQHRSGRELHVQAVRRGFSSSVAGRVA